MIKGDVYMSDLNWAQLDETVKQLLKVAGKNIIGSFESALDIQTKADANDLVTNIDQDTEQFFINHIREHFPTHRVLGEEGFGDDIKSTEGVIWIIDPIDGTMNFVHQQRNFYISIGIFEDGEKRLGYLYDVVYDELYNAIVGEGAYWDNVKLPMLEKVSVDKAIIGMNHSMLATNIHMDPKETLIPLVKDARGMRSYGSAALEFAFVATGRLDAYISMQLSPWDFAGGQIIVEEVGGIVTDIKGEPLNILEKSTVVAAKPGLHDEIIKQYLNK